MTRKFKVQALFIMAALVSTFAAHAQNSRVVEVKTQPEKQCRYEVKLWGRLSANPSRVSVIGEVRRGDSVWYTVIRSPGDQPEMVPQKALETPYPSGTCMTFLAGLADEINEAWSQYTSDMIHEDDIEIPVPARTQKPNQPAAPPVSQPTHQNIALGQDSQAAK